MLLLLGIVIGSFNNVCIFRLPKEMSIIYPRSACSSCITQLKLFDLIPILSFILRLGRCRHCGAKISWRYPAVELLTGIVFMLLGLKYPLGGALIPYLTLASVLIIISFIDYDHFYIPDKILLTGAVLWGILRVFFRYMTLQSAIFGAALGFGAMYLIYLAARGGMGFGDVKLAALIGLYLGPALLGLTLVVSFIIGAVAGISLIMLKVKGRKDMLPFGPFLAIGAYISMMWGPAILTWYSAMIGL